MTRLPFHFSTSGALYCADFVSDLERPVHRHWTGFANVDELLKHAVLPWDALAVNNNNQEEVAVYLGLVWALTEGYERCVVATGYSVDAAERLGREGTITRWEYSADVEQPPGVVVERGFVRSRSSVRTSPEPTERQRYMRDKAKLFVVTRFEDLVALQRVVLSDACTELNIFAIGPGRHQALAEALSGERTPVWRDLLVGDEIFIDLCVGVDLGYNDAILVRSLVPIEPRLGPISGVFEAAIVEYESRVASVSTVPDAVAAMRVLARQPVG